MIHLHCTKKLLAKLPLRDDARIQTKTPEPDLAETTEVSPIDHWHANLILLQRRQCVLFVHDATRFPVLIPALKKADFSNLEPHFADGFMNTLLKCGAGQQVLDRAQTALAPFCCDSVCSRSVQGTMNQMTQMLDATLEYERMAIMDIGPYSTSAWLAETPCNVKGVKGPLWPNKNMLEL